MAFTAPSFGVTDCTTQLVVTLLLSLLRKARINRCCYIILKLNLNPTGTQRTAETHDKKTIPLSLEHVSIFVVTEEINISTNITTTFNVTEEFKENRYPPAVTCVIGEQ